jgi:hypothetical protein
MHHCLNIPEVIDKIFDELTKDYMVDPNFERDFYDPYDRQLLNLAISCKTFSGPALAYLWKNLPDAQHIFRCIDRDLLEEVQISEETSELVSLFWDESMRLWSL